jgi:hypothetical protein
MAQMLPLLSIMVTHEYLGGAALSLRFVPSDACAALMLREGLVLRTTPGSAELWREVPDGDGPDALPDTLPLAFSVFASDPQLHFCTAWPVATPLRFVDADDSGVLQAETLAGSGASRAPLFSIEIAVRPAVQGAVPARYRIALASKKIRWKYFFSGSLAAKKLRIVDLDGANGGGGARFAASALPATAGGSAYTSEGAFPMQRIPQQRLQLREDGAAGKVLIRRLPNANIAKLGKERGRDGLSMIVAEIYIHQ